MIVLRPHQERAVGHVRAAFRRVKRVVLVALRAIVEGRTTPPTVEEAEGRADAVERARHPLVRVTRCPVTPDPRAAALARAIEEMDDYGFGGGL